jgi:arabinose-5-phosphate isomerase
MGPCQTPPDGNPTLAAPPHHPSTPPAPCAWPSETFEIERPRAAGPGARQGDGFARACAMLACRGRVVVMGMGKSGHVGRKIAATLASTGTPAMFVHPAEASHGDLGMVTPGDVVLAISNSGESDELAAILPVLKRLGVPLVAMTGKPESTLAATPTSCWTARSKRRPAR